MMKTTILVNDGYNGHTMEMDIEPVREDQRCYMLRGAKEETKHLIAWISKADYVRLLFVSGESK